MPGRIEGKLDLTEQSKKDHRAPRAGKSAEKKKTADKKKRGLPTEPEKLNPKAFATGRPGTAAAARKKLDRSQHNAHLPTMDRSFADEMNEPPETVAVVGPPGCGKTTLIRSLVKYFTKQNLTNVKGPVTCIAGKQRRITFFECPNDINAMCDVARVADLVLLVVDASFGFEMETFEFLNISKAHGFPKLIGILTHLDKLKDNKQLKKTKRAMRHRFWQEVCPGAKLFYLSGLDKNMYNMKEVVNLNRFIAVTRLTPQNWRTTHSCVLADRMEDMTDPAVKHADPLANRKIALYGYVRGCPLRENQRVHIPGVGDFSIAETDRLDDPCALPQKGNKRSGRHLSEKDKRLYAPMADVGGLIYDADAIYVKVDEQAEEAVQEGGEGLRIMNQLKTDGARAQTVDAKLKSTSISLFDGGAALRRSGAGGEPVDDDEDDDDESDGGASEAAEDKPPFTSEPVTDASGRVRRRVHFVDAAVEEIDKNESEDETDDDDDDDDAYEKVVLPSDRSSGRHDDVDLRKFSLGDDADDDDLLFKVQGEVAAHAAPELHDLTRDVRGVVEEQWEVETIREGIRDLFVTGKWTDDESGFSKGGEPAAVADPTVSDPLRPRKRQREFDQKGYESVSSDDDEADGMVLDDDNDGENEESDEEMESDDGSIADAGEAPAVPKQSKHQTLTESVRALIPAGLLKKPEGVAVEPAPAAQPEGGKTKEESERDEMLKKKIAKKKAFDEKYDTSGSGGDYLTALKEEAESTRNRNHEMIAAATAGDIDEKIKLVGYYAGIYVRIVIDNAPAEFVENFNPNLPLLVGGLLPSEDRLGVVYCRLKKHRWYPKILKANDPLVLSIGWRRFQTQPIFAIEDPNGRNRYLKYTPLHMHCVAAFYGPITPPNTGVIAFTNTALQASVSHFRCSATGYVMEVDHSSRIVKKLKLTGVPAKVYKNTAFIKNMFSSALEVAKFEGAKLQTVSGIRGTVKRAISGKGGVFRATFEDKIQLGAIIFLKTWKAVEPNKYYNPVTNLLVTEWQAMKSMAEIRRARNMPVPYSVDSIYKAVNRPSYFNTSLKIPANLEGRLPFHEKKLRMVEKPGVSSVDQQIAEETTLVLEPEEQKRRDLLEKFTLIDNIKKRSEKIRLEKRHTKYGKEKEKKEAKATDKLKALKKKNSKLAEFRNSAKRQKK
ncbi:Ribosome biogenesis protein bms1 [Diplonema papillatum]|nr:Ribosome biogenesis protein bms1 [Diplonema papillatum]KAJ9458754.1 Ribosome biogenesis protein bms1 [Diplonema papillatum]